MAKPIEAERILSDTRSLAASPLMGSAMRPSPPSLTPGLISLAVGELQIALLWAASLPASNIFQEVWNVWNFEAHRWPLRFGNLLVI